MKRLFCEGRKLWLIILYTCVISGTVTYMTLSFAAAAGRKQALLRTASRPVPLNRNVGYSFETVTTKRNLLLSVTDGGGLSRAHIFSFDEDKHTLEVLEIPPMTRISADGFEGTVAEAYESEVYRELVSRVFMLKIDGEISLEADTLSRCATALGGIPINVTEPVNIGEAFFTKGRRTLVGSRVGIIAADGEAYLSANRGRIELYRRLLASFIKKMSEQGALSWFPELMNIIINEAETGMDLSELLELISVADAVAKDKISISLLPGCIEDGFYLADPEKTAELLNVRFRVKGNKCDSEQLGFDSRGITGEEYPDLKQKIEDLTK